MFLIIAEIMSASNDFLTRIFRIAISSLLVSSFVVGCIPLHLPPPTPTVAVTLVPTASPTPYPIPTASPTSAIQLKEEQLQGVHLQFWHPYSDEIGDAFDRLAEEFSQQNPWKIHIESTRINGVDLLNERMKTALDQGELPHLVIAPLYQALRWHKEKEILVDWSSYTDDLHWGLTLLEKEQFYPNLWGAGVLDEDRWGIPARRVVQLLLYNASWARALGLDAAPRTFTEFQQQSCAVLANSSSADTRAVMGYLFTHDYPTIFGWLTAFGAQIAVNEEKGYEFESPEVKEALTYLRKLYEQRCAAEEQTLDELGVFAQRQSLIVPVNSGQLWAIEQKMKVASNQDRWTLLPFPTAKGEGASVLYGTDFVLLRSSVREQLAAWLFVKWVLSQENQQRLAEETLGLPLRSDVGKELEKDVQLPSAYREVLEVLPKGLNEPLWASWDTVRWAVGDASRQLVAWYFTLEQIPTLMQILDKTAAELHGK
ncbi:MAG: hypothetical protein Kow0088_19600 [Anaerolineales bacterium]